MSFIHLHVHSCYSPQDGAQSCDQIAEKAARLGMNAVALTDHGRAGGLLAFKKACEKHNIKPIYGFEAYVAPEDRFLKEKIDGHKPSYHLCLLAKDEEGLKNIFRMTSIGWKDGFYYKPRIDMEVLEQHSEGVICLSGCGSGKSSYLIQEDRYGEALENMRELKRIFGKDLYIEIQNHGLDWQQPLMNGLAQISEDINVPLVATQDSHYQEQEDAKMHGAICKLAAGDLEFDSDQSFFKSEEEMRQTIPEEYWSAIDITQEIADKCNCNWEYGSTIWPIYPLEDGESPEEALRSLAQAGFNRLFPEATDEYKERLEYELGIINQMGFPTYFLVVQDFINWAKNNDIPVGPGRGSGAGSLVCYCIGITNVDPIKYGLYFERFLNPSRMGSPKIETTELSMDEFKKNILPSLDTVMKSIDKIIRKEVEKEAIEEWNQLAANDKQYISYLLSTNKKYSNNNNSMCLYALGITDEEPIKAVSRNSDGGGLCDIDVDFCPKGRKRVMQYVYEKYGPEKCAQIGTYAVFKPRGSLRDFARVLGHPISVGEQLAKMVPPDVSGKSMKFDNIADEKTKTTLIDTIRRGLPQYEDVIEMAYKAEGLVSQAGVHAAGVVISNSELAAQVPLFNGKHNEVATQFDMHEIEEVGLVKYDFLGLKNLTVIHDAVKMIKKYRNIDIDIDAIDQEDQIVFENIFQKGRLEGIFQFETSSGFRDLCIKIKPRSIEDLSAITALFRPGPLSAKENPDDKSSRTLVEKYVDGRNGDEVKYLFNQLEPVLNDSYAVMVYQEQIMRICTDCAGYTLAEADNMRKIIGKKLPEKMALEKEKLVNGCVANGISKDKAVELFEQIEGFAAYSFNKAHSVAYSFVSYQTAWLKHYYPEEFYCALLNNSFKNQDDLVKYIHAIKIDEIPIMPPDVNMSDTGFTISEGTIVFGLAGVKGMGEKACVDLIKKRPQEGFTSIAELVANKINKGSISALAMCGALEEISEVSREQVVANIEEIVTYYQKANKIEERKAKIAEREKQIAMWTKGDGPKPRKLPGINEKHIPVFPDLQSKTLTKRDKLQFERKTLGFYLTGHPMDSFPGLSKMAEFTVQDIKEAKMENRTKFSIPVVVSTIIEKRTRKGQNMGVLMVEDKTGRIETTIFPRQWSKIKDILTEDSVYVLKCSTRIEIGSNENDPPIVSLILDSATKIDNDSDALQMHPIEFGLADGTQITFSPEEEQNYSKWQQAVAFVNNMKRMG